MVTVKKRSPPRTSLSLSKLLSHFLIGVCCFYMGMVFSLTGTCECPPCLVSQQQNAAETSSFSSEEEPQAQAKVGKPAIVTNNNNLLASNQFPEGLHKGFAERYGTIPREDVNHILEIGVPLDESRGVDDALILYPRADAVPNALKSSTNNRDKKDVHLKMNASMATENCMSVKLILQQPQPNKNECLIIMPQWESFGVHKFMRLPKQDDQAENKNLPFRAVSISHKENGQYSTVPDPNSAVTFHKSLVEYLTHLERISKPLKEQLSKLNTPTNTVIVLVCNHGQSELLHNFVCNAKAKGLDLSQIFLIATDEKTRDLGNSLEIETFFDQAIFEDMPEQAAGGYADRIFTKMMMAKVYCVHMVLQAGFNVLFQDVDVVWNQNPLKYLESPELQEWDLMFQDDGARTIRYAPYSPNTGFYYVRNNHKTIYFFNMLLRHGDFITKVKSHQAGLVAVMNYHVTWKNLRVKTFARGPTTKFPGGAEYHRYAKEMKQWITLPITSKDKPQIFHMSWTMNKKHKKLYFEQMGEWYTGEESKCNGLDCCQKEPIVTCHYRDKPSSVYCGMKDPIDKGKKSFWKDQQEIDDLKKQYANS